MISTDSFYLFFISKALFLYSKIAVLLSTFFSFYRFKYAFLYLRILNLAYSLTTARLNLKYLRLHNAILQCLYITGMACIFLTTVFLAIYPFISRCTISELALSFFCCFLLKYSLIWRWILTTFAIIRRCLNLMSLSILWPLNHI